MFRRLIARVTLLAAAAAMLCQPVTPATAQVAIGVGGAVADKTPAVLSQIPEDSSVVLIVPDLKKADEGLGTFLAAVGVDAPPAKAPVKSLFEQLGATRGIDMDGSAAVVMPMLMMGAAPRVFVLLPVTDPQQFLANFDDATDAPNTQGLKQVTLGNGRVGFVKFSGKYAVVSDIELTAAQQKPAGDPTKLMKAAGPLGQANLGRNDAVLYVNLSKIGPMVSGMAAMGLSAMQMQILQDPDMTRQMGGQDAVTAMFRMYGTLLSNILLQTDAMLVGLSANQAGAQYTVSMQFKPDSPPAAVFAKTSGLDLTLDKLPSEPAMFAMAMDSQAIDWTPFVKAIEEIKGAVTADSPMAKVLDAYAKNFELAGMFQLAQMAWYAPPADKPGELINFAYVYGTAEPDRMMTRMRDVSQAMTRAYSAMGEATGNAGMAMGYKANAAELNGKPVDRMTFTLDKDQMMPPGAPGEIPPFLESLFDTWTFSITPQAGSIVLATGKDDALLKRTIAAADDSGRLGRGPVFAEARKLLPPARFAEMYFDATTIIRFVMDAAKANGEEVPDVKVPAMTAFAASMSSADGGMSTTIVAPMSSIKSVRDFMDEVQKAQRQRWQEQMGQGEDEGHGPVPAEAVEVQ